MTPKRTHTVRSPVYRSTERMFPGTFAPWNESSWELLLLGAKVPENFRSRERMFPVGTFAPRSENTGERKVPEPTLFLLSLTLIICRYLKPTAIVLLRHFIIRDPITTLAIFVPYGWMK